MPPKQRVEEHGARCGANSSMTSWSLCGCQRGSVTGTVSAAAHFGLGLCRCGLWSRGRLWVSAASGRQRFNGLGAWNAVPHQWGSVCQTPVVTQETFCERLRTSAALSRVRPITWVRDNARSPPCARCLEHAKQRGIERRFRPSYAPNRNRIERLGKFVKKDGRYARHVPSFTDFRSRIEDGLTKLGSTHKSKLGSLMTRNFQTFANRTILAA